MPSQRIFLIVGATGKQGGAVLAGLSQLLAASPKTPTTTPAPRILALTRAAPTSAKGQALAARYPGLDLTVVQGDTREGGALLAAHPGITGIFAYTTPPDEGAQAVPLIDAAAALGSGVTHFVFSSVDRGGDVASWDAPTDIPHFRAKHDIEQHLRATLGAAGAPPSSAPDRPVYTILRPTAFMDNLNPTSYFGPAFAALWATMPPTTALQLVSVRDVGRAAARALLAPPPARNEAFGLAGDALRYEEARAVFERVAGRALPQAPRLLGSGMRWALGEVGTMFRWFETHGYGVDIAARRAAAPEGDVQDFETWLRESSQFEWEGKKP